VISRQNSVLDARPTFDPTIPEFRCRQFGGTLGLPILKNKLFVFGDYQGLRQCTPVSVDHASVPTAIKRQGNFSELLNPAVCASRPGGTAERQSSRAPAGFARQRRFL
jgi:hypothetical protein